MVSINKAKLHCEQRAFSEYKKRSVVSGQQPDPKKLNEINKNWMQYWAVTMAWKKTAMREKLMSSWSKLLHRRAGAQNALACSCRKERSEQFAFKKFVEDC